MSRLATETTHYVLGNTVGEHERLRRQSRLLDRITRHWLENIGLRAGMRILDVGSGVGDTAILLASLAGPTAEIIGVDATGPHWPLPARESPKRDSIASRSGNFLNYESDRTFGALVGRLVLVHQPDPISALRSLLTHVCPGGIISPSHNAETNSAASSQIIGGLLSWPGFHSKWRATLRGQRTGANARCRPAHRESRQPHKTIPPPRAATSMCAARHSGGLTHPHPATIFRCSPALDHRSQAPVPDAVYDTTRRACLRATPKRYGRRLPRPGSYPLGRRQISVNVFCITSS